MENAGHFRKPPGFCEGPDNVETIAVRLAVVHNERQPALNRQVDQTGKNVALYVAR